MNCDVERWQRDGTREATAERPCDEMLALMKVEIKTCSTPGGANGDDGSPGQLREARVLWSIMTKSMDAK
ncbi:hypothetical protein CDV31_017071 [Fusarium ambrosium]|uniref:Uncharacterized protein n=1 Tax=Fusarium ambrosium TaxID=131363 RepID=A0A428RU30_9HYPO|nr:hypothetical protein CDV31_017071 [Fusarium ambrosium]